MTPGRIAMLFALAVAGGIGWVSFDNRFGRPGEPRADGTIPAPPSISTDTLSAGFDLCAGGVRVNCVVDGDTFWFLGEKIRIADIDAPEISQPACAAERQLGEMSRDRLLAMLNEDRFSLMAGWRDEDRYGRKLRVLSRSGKSLGESLADQGLARRWNGPNFGWCGDADVAAIGAER